MGRFLTKWGSLTQRLVASTASSVAALVGLYLVFEQQPVKFEGWPRLLVIAAILLAVLSVCLEVVAERRVHVRLKIYARNDKAGIKEYMQRWIAECGRAAVWTRDLSWVDDDKTRDLLLSKAREKSLTLCMPRMNDIGQALREAGATVYTYGAAEFDSPASRFTIAYSGNGGTRVAIARPTGDAHVIEEFDASDPVFHMADDLISLARRASKGA
jgi:hypothetical protein